MQAVRVKGAATAEAMDALGKALRSKFLDNDSARNSVLKSISKDMAFSCSQVADLLDYFYTPSVRSDMVLNVFTSITDRSEFDQVEVRLTQEEVTEIQQKLGELYYFDGNFPTGHYRLDCKNTRHVEIFQRLLAINNDEKIARNEAGLPDTSQLGDRQQFRNEVLDDKIVHVTGTWKLPVAGIIECAKAPRCRRG